MTPPERLPTPPWAAGVDPGAFAPLRARLRSIGFDDQLFAVTESIDAGLVNPLRLPLVRQALRARGDAAAVLALLLVYTAPIAETDARAALGDEGFTLLARCGVVVPDEAGTGAVRAAFRVAPFGPVVVVADQADAGTDAVMPPSGTTSLLASLMPHQPPARVLDVGTGPGTLALLAAARGADAVATDLSGRALEFARFNAALNGLTLDVRQGDLLAPVAGEQFELVVSQPPFIVEPGAIGHVTFLHGGDRGDNLALALAAGLPDVLTPGGVALLRFDMPLAPGETATEHVRAAVGPAVSVAVLEQPAAGFHLQAIAYAALHDPTLGSRFAELAATYVDHYAAIGVQRAVAATVVLVRPADTDAPRFTASASARVATDWVGLRRHLTALETAVSDDGDLLGVRVRAVAGCRLSVERDVDAIDGDRRYFARFDPEAPLADAELAPIEAALLQRIADGVTVADLVAGFAEEVGADPAAAAAPVLGFVRENLARGLLVL